MLGAFSIIMTTLSIFNDCVHTNCVRSQHENVVVPQSNHVNEENINYIDNTTLKRDHIIHATLEDLVMESMKVRRGSGSSESDTEVAFKMHIHTFNREEKE